MVATFNMNDWNGTVSQPYLDRATTSGGVSLARIEQPVASPGGAWVARIDGVKLNDRERLLAWRAFALQAAGGARDFVVTLCEKRQGPWPVVAGRRVYTPGGIVSTLTAAAALNDTTLAINVSAGGTVLAGMKLSLTGTRWGKRLYGIEEIISSGGGNYSLRIAPGLRDDMASGSAVDFETPGCTMRVITPAADLFPVVNGLKRASVGVAFMESFSR